NKRGIKRLPIIDNGRLVGIVTRANLVRALVKALITEPTGGGSDDRIRDAILRSIDTTRWAPRFAIDVAVEGGIADLSGERTDRECSGREGHPGSPDLGRIRFPNRCAALGIPSCRPARDPEANALGRKTEEVISTTCIQQVRLADTCQCGWPELCQCGRVDPR